MKQRTATEQKHLDEIADKIRNLGGFLPVVVTVTEGKKIRTDLQNAAYWCEMKHFLSQITEAVTRLSDFSGYTVAEVRRIIADTLPPDQAGIVYALSPEAAHDCLKEICGIPTSTRLGTKAFMKFEGRLEQTMTEIIGYINAVVYKAAA